MRRLVVNADDLGLTTAVNDGIFDAHRHGILTSASLFPNAPATADAIERVRSVRSLGVGVHLTLVDGVPVLPPASIPTLVEGDGRFRRSWKPFIVACLTGRISLGDVERELTAQIQRVLAAGIAPTHADAHKHVHAYPPVFSVVATLAARFGIPTVRIPYEQPQWAAMMPLPADRARWIERRQAALNAVMWPWARANARVASSLGLQTPRFLGRVHTGLLDEPSLHRLLAGIGAGVTELMVHPGYVDTALIETGTRLVDSREEELALLCIGQTRALVGSERISLVRHGSTETNSRSFRHVS